MTDVLSELQTDGVIEIDPLRRKVLKTGASLFGSVALANAPIAVAQLARAASAPDAAQRPRATAVMTAGPFFPEGARRTPTPQVNHADLVPPNEPVAGNTSAGREIRMDGRVFSASGMPIPAVRVVIWQANQAGRYNHPADQRDTPMDPGFSGWGVVSTDRRGQYSVRTILPGAYPLGRGAQRAPHLHLALTAPGGLRFTTQMLFPGHPLNDTDGLYRRLAPAQRRSVVAYTTSLRHQYRFDIVLPLAT